MTFNKDVIKEITDKKYPPEVDLWLRILKVFPYKKDTPVTLEDLQANIDDKDYPFPVHAIPIDKFVMLQRYKNQGKYCDRNIDQFIDDMANDIYQIDHEEP